MTNEKFNTLNETVMTFTTREEYFEWRAEWRAAYKELSLNIRSEKLETVRLQRVGNFGPRDAWRARSLVQTANKMLDLRARSKELAGIQQAKHKEEAVGN